MTIDFNEIILPKQTKYVSNNFYGKLAFELIYQSGNLTTVRFKYIEETVKVDSK